MRNCNFLRLIYNKVTSRSYGHFLKFSYFNFLRNWFFQLCQKLQSLVKKTQGILGVNSKPPDLSPSLTNPIPHAQLPTKIIRLNTLQHGYSRIEQPPPFSSPLKKFPERVFWDPNPDHTKLAPQTSILVPTSEPESTAPAQSPTAMPTNKTDERPNKRMKLILGQWAHPRRMPTVHNPPPEDESMRNASIDSPQTAIMRTTSRSCSA
jgi:hypothetical protein